MLPSTTPSTDAARPSALQHTHRLEPDDVVVELTTRHLFGLGKVLASVRLVLAEVQLDERGRLVSLEAVLDPASFSSGSRSRDRAVTSARLLDAAQHPHLSFRSRRVVPTAGGGWTVEGTLTARGVDAPVTLEVRPAGPGNGPVRATARVDRFAHGITAGRCLASRHLDVAITVVAESPAQP